MKLLKAGKIEQSDLDSQNEVFKDLVDFDIAFNVAYCQLIYMIVLIMSIISPAIIFFGFVFFFLKYYIDKYNLIVLYPKNHGGQGEIAASI